VPAGWKQPGDLRVDGSELHVGADDALCSALITDARFASYRGVSSMLARRFVTFALATLPFLVTFASGCAAPASNEDDAEGSSELNARGVVTQPDGGYIADVTAAGSGCPAGSWSAAISPDGQTFTLYFSAYEARVVPGQSFDMKQCVINIGMRDPGGRPLSFVVGSIYHQGYLLLDQPGMRASRNAIYAFGGTGGGRGTASPPPQHREIPGPYDSSYVQGDDVFAGRWSPCSAINNLVINTSLMLQNNPQRTGSGYVNRATVDGALTLAFRLDWHRC
jgi:hypothetical protein